MSSKRPTTDALIESLAQDAAASPRLFSAGAVVAGWLAAATAYTVGLTVLLGPVRGDAWQQFTTNMTFATEITVAILAFILLAAYAVRSSIPGRSNKTFLWFGTAGLIAFVALIASGLITPYLEPSMHGKRDHCIWEAFLYSVPSVAGLAYLLQRRYLLTPRLTLATGAAAAGLIPAVTMQWACMHDPVHGLAFHVAPLFALIAAVLLARLGYERLFLQGNV